MLGHHQPPKQLQLITHVSEASLEGLTSFFFILTHSIISYMCFSIEMINKIFHQIHQTMATITSVLIHFGHLGVDQ